MRNLYSKIYYYLQKIDFNQIWSGFSPCEFALYNDHTVFFINHTHPTDERFVGNTSILYNGYPLAIWKVSSPESEDPILLTSKIVHEMFHSFQIQHQENRFPDDLAMLSYPEDAALHTLRHREYQILSSVFSAKSTPEKHSLLKQFMELRKYRAVQTGSIIEQEFFAETIEGMAEYAGLIALKQLSPLKYQEKLSENIRILQTLSPSFFDIRKMCYYTGSMFCLALSELQIDFYHEIGKTDLSLFEIVSENIPTKECILPVNPEIEQFLCQIKQEKKQLFSEFLSSHKELVKVNACISGYDPMNMIKLDQQLLCTHFILLQPDSSNESLFIKGPVMLLLSDTSNHNIEGYIL